MRKIADLDKTSSEHSSRVKKLVVVALPLITEGEISLVQGVREELERRGGYEVMVMSHAYETALRRLAASGHLAGVIGDFVGEAWARALIRKGVHVVAIGAGLSGITSITCNVRRMGSEASGVFLSSGVESLGYLGPSGAPGSIRLGEAFSEACLAGGMEVSTCASASFVLLRHFLRSLARPAGLLCASDHLAALAIAAAGEESLRVPHDLAVIGVGNARLESIHAGMGISSMEEPHGEIGRLAATAMAELLHGGNPTSVSVDPLLHERESSLRSGSGMVRALAWLRSHPSSTVTAGELARMAGMSRRSFEMAVKNAKGSSPGRILREKRRARAEELLKGTELPVATVGRECGYPDAAAFSAAFRRWNGMPPREFRKAFRSVSDHAPSG
jgi:LacI family transcriptional regulator